MLFGQSSVLFLGHIVSQDGIQPNPEKTQAVRQFPRPRNVKDVPAFVVLASYCCQFVNNFASIATSLTRLTQKNTPFKWDESCETAFEQLKATLVSSPIFAYPNFPQPFHLYVDASAYGLDYVLGQYIYGKKLSLPMVVDSSTTRRKITAPLNVKR